MKIQIETENLTKNEQDVIFRMASGKFAFCEDCALCDKTYPHTWQCPSRMCSVSEGDYCESGYKKRNDSYIPGYVWWHDCCNLDDRDVLAWRELPEPWEGEAK